MMLSVRNGSGGEGTAEGTASKPPKVVQEVSATQIFLCISMRASHQNAYNG